MDKIYYFYSVWQPKFQDEANISFIQGLPDKKFINDLNVKKHDLLIIDDQQMPALNFIIIADLFTKFSHHKNVSLVLIFQNLFHLGKYHRDISLNAHYFILFKNPRDIQQIKVLGSQLGKRKELLNAYSEATKDSYSYLLIDLSPRGEPGYMFRSHIFPDEHPTVYI